jgi:ferritin-like metal-binding protein YciE
MNAPHPQTQTPTDDTHTADVVTYLLDAHAIEEQALAQLRRAPGIAGAPALAKALADHLLETEIHEQLVRERLEQLDASPSSVRDIVAAAGGQGFVLFARAQPDTPGKLAAHAYSYEHLEAAGYAVLAAVADAHDDAATARLARRIGEEEHRMGLRLHQCFPDAVAASVEGAPQAELEDRVPAYLADAHALAGQAQSLMERALGQVGDAAPAGALRPAQEAAGRHLSALERRLEELGGSPSMLKDAALRLGALSWTGFFRAQPDTPPRFAAFIYAVMHLQVAGYEELSEVARLSRDDDTLDLGVRLAEENRGLAGTLFAALGETVGQPPAGRA